MPHWLCRKDFFMKKYGFLRRLFGLLALLLSHAMCAVVAYHYSALQFGIEYLGFSAPANLAFLLRSHFAPGSRRACCWRGGSAAKRARAVPALARNSGEKLKNLLDSARCG